MMLCYIIFYIIWSLVFELKCLNSLLSLRTITKRKFNYYSNFEKITKQNTFNEEYTSIIIIITNYYYYY